MTAESTKPYLLPPVEPSRVERLKPRQFLDQLYTRFHAWAEEEKSGRMIAGFGQMTVEDWEVLPDTREAGLGPGVGVPFALERGFIAEVDGDYVGVALGEGARSYGMRVPRLQFGFRQVETFRPDDYIRQRIAVYTQFRESNRQDERTQALAELDQSADFTPKAPQDLRTLLRQYIGSRTGEVNINEFGSVIVRSELDSGIYVGGENLSRWQQEKLLTENGLDRTQNLFLRVKNTPRT
jgi:hypothetical protein